MLTGSCLCKAVQYQITGALSEFVHCHCRTCRKVHGTVYGSSALVQRGHFRLISGAEALTAYQSSPGKERCFCRACGSHVFARLEARPQEIILRVGTLDSDPKQRPQAHIWVRYKAPWYAIQDALPQYEQGPAT
jgi:hypothetical protein